MAAPERGREQLQGILGELSGGGPVPRVAFCGPTMLLVLLLFSQERIYVKLE